MKILPITLGLLLVICCCGLFVYWLLVHTLDVSLIMKNRQTSSCLELEKTVLPQVADPLNNEKSQINAIPSKSKLEKYDVKSLAKIYHTFVINNEIHCRRLVRMGKVSDGGYNLCADKRFTIRKPCLVYSFGINDDFSFDDFVHQTYGCEVHSFDPSMKMADGTKRSPNVVFHRIGLHDKDTVLANKWQMQTLQTIKKKLGHSKKSLDILKMDIEGSEWKALPNILATNEINSVWQLIVEFHVSDSNGLSKNFYIEHLELFRNLQNRGFRVLYAERNAYNGYYDKSAKEMRSNCHNVFMVKLDSGVNLSSLHG